jgi:integral membrane protein (TIGR01906 family)
MSIFKTAAQGLFILCLPVLLLSASLAVAANCPWLYRHGFDKYGVGQTTELADTDLEKVIGRIIGYFNSGEEDISIIVEKGGQPFVLFNEREVAHMRDVKGLIRLDYYLLLGTLIGTITFTALCLFLWRDRRRLAWGLFGGGALTLALMAVLGIVIALDFEDFFLRFHMLSFANEFWRLDPARDYLIMLFPQGFWFDAALYCTVAAAAGAFVLGGVGWWLKTKGKSKTDVW